MLTPLELSDKTIITCLQDNFGLRIADVTFLPIGADANAAVYRVNTMEGSSYFLKLKHGEFDESTVAIPFFLHERGISAVMAPIKSTSNRLWVSEHDLSWILYPFIESQTGYQVRLSDTQWIALGEGVRSIHETVLPEILSSSVPREKYSSEGRAVVKKFDLQVTTQPYADPIAARLAGFWRSKRSDIHAMLERSDELGRSLQQRNIDFE